MAKINDPVRAEAYAHLGIATLCRTNLMATAVLAYAGQAAPGTRPGIYAPEQPARCTHARRRQVGGRPTPAAAHAATRRPPGAGTPGSEG